MRLQNTVWLYCFGWLMVTGGGWEIRCSAQTTRSGDSPRFITAATDLKAVVGHRICVSGAAIGGVYNKLPTMLDCGFYTFQISEMLYWPVDVQGHSIVVVGDLFWREPYMAPPINANLQTSIHPGLQQGFFGLSNIQWMDKSRSDLLDIVAPKDEKSLQDLVEKQILIHGVAEKRSPGDSIHLKCPFYRFEIPELNSWPDTASGKEISLIGALHWNEPVKEQGDDGKWQIIREGYYYLTDVHLIQGAIKGVGRAGSP
jgi:hypothetical protein